MAGVDNNTSRFLKRVFLATLVIAIFVAVIFLVLKGIKFLLILFSAALLAILYRGCAGWLSEKTNLPKKYLLPVVILLHLFISVVVIWLLYPRISEQVNILATELPEIVRKLLEDFKASDFGKFIIGQLPNSNEYIQNPDQLVATIFNFLKTTLGVAIDLLVIFVLAIFIAANPGLYKKGFVYLFPIEKRTRVAEVWETINITLFKWFLGKILDMFSVFLMTAIALWIMGIPLVLTLALIAFLFSFVPNVGPVISALPALLLAFTIKPIYVVYVGLVYLGIQLFESYFITPGIQKRAIQMAPVLLLLFQLFMAKLTGVLGLFISTPLLAAFIIIIKMVYIEDFLGDHGIEVKGENEAKNKAI